MSEPHPLHSSLRQAATVTGRRFLRVTFLRVKKIPPFDIRQINGISTTSPTTSWGLTPETAPEHGSTSPPGPRRSRHRVAPKARGGGGHFVSAVSPNSERSALAFAFTSALGFLISASPFSRIAAFSGLTALTVATMAS